MKYGGPRSSLRQRCKVLMLMFQRKASSVSVKAGSVNMALLSSFVLGITAANATKAKLQAQKRPALATAASANRPL
ncbi:hypothetical protein GCM10009079_18700 [Ralstonia mannitolilytica]